MLFCSLLVNVWLQHFTAYRAPFWMHFRLHKTTWLLYALNVNKHKHNYIMTDERLGRLMTVTHVGIKWITQGDYFAYGLFFSFLCLYTCTVLYYKAMSIHLSFYHHLPTPNIYLFVFFCMQENPLIKRQRLHVFLFLFYLII